MGELADRVRGGRRNQQQIDVRSNRDVLDVGVGARLPLVGDDLAAAFERGDLSAKDALAELRALLAGSDEYGETAKVSISPSGTHAINYAFDVTPARLVTGLITERGVAPASADNNKWNNGHGNWNNGHGNWNNGHGNGHHKHKKHWNNQGYYYQPGPVYYQPAPVYHRPSISIVLPIRID